MLDATEESDLSFKRILSRARVQSRLKDDACLSCERIDSREGEHSPEVDRIGLDGFPRFFPSFHMSPLAIFLPFGTQDVLLVENPVYRRNGNVLPVFLFRKVPDLLTAASPPFLTDFVNAGFHENIGFPRLFSPSLGVFVVPNELVDTLEFNPFHPAVDGSPVLFDLFRDGFHGDTVLIIGSGKS